MTTHTRGVVWHWGTCLTSDRTRPDVDNLRRNLWEGGTRESTSTSKRLRKWRYKSCPAGILLNWRVIGSRSVRMHTWEKEDHYGEENFEDITWVVVIEIDSAGG